MRISNHFNELGEIKMKPFDYYRANPIPHKSHVDFSTTHYYKEGKLIKTLLSSEYPNFEFGVKETVIDREAQKAHEVKYQAEESRLDAEFKSDLFEDLGITDNPKRELLFRLAWGMGHSHGYSDVYSIACDLVELIRN